MNHRALGHFYRFVSSNRSCSPYRPAESEKQRQCEHRIRQGSPTSRSIHSHSMFPFELATRIQEPGPSPCQSRLPDVNSPSADCLFSSTGATAQILTAFWHFCKAVVWMFGGFGQLSAVVCVVAQWRLFQAVASTASNISRCICQITSKHTVMMCNAYKSL